jgi:hypothetical protein
MLAGFLTLIVVFGAGLYVGAFKPPIYLAIRVLYKAVRKELPPPRDSRYVTIPPDMQATDVESQIQISSPEDVFQKRKELIDYIWKGKGLPGRESFDKTEEISSDAAYAVEASKTLKYTIAGEYGIDSYAYHAFARRPRNELVIINSGHAGKLEFDSMRFFLAKGYDVIAFSMPLFEPNNQPLVDVPRLGRVRMNQHDQLKFLDTPDFSSIKYFVEPIAIAMNYVKRNLSYTAINMVGVSGGGWTAVLYAALDPRVLNSYPVAGTYPLFLRDEDFGDYEQTVPELYRIANYLELYILGSYGEGRRQLHIFNQYDPCCFEGVRYRVYHDALRARLHKLQQDGHYDVFLDKKNYEHTISEEALAEIAADIERNRETN